MKKWKWIVIFWCIVSTTYFNLSGYHFVFKIYRKSGSFYAGDTFNSSEAIWKISKNKEIPVKFQGEYKKWLQYYLCRKYTFPETNQESLPPFIRKLEEKDKLNNNKNNRFVLYLYTMNCVLWFLKTELFNDKNQIFSIKKRCEKHQI